MCVCVCVHACLCIVMLVLQFGLLWLELFLSIVILTFLVFLLVVSQCWCLNLISVQHTKLSLFSAGASSD